MAKHCSSIAGVDLLAATKVSMLQRLRRDGHLEATFATPDTTHAKYGDLLSSVSSGVRSCSWQIEVEPRLFACWKSAFVSTALQSPRGMQMVSSETEGKRAIFVYYVPLPGAVVTQSKRVDGLVGA